MCIKILVTYLEKLLTKKSHLKETPIYSYKFAINLKLIIFGSSNNFMSTLGRLIYGGPVPMSVKQPPAFFLIPQIESSCVGTKLLFIQRNSHVYLF
jgi:hypothetical protein